MKVEFLKPGAGFGLGYHSGEVADLDDAKAKNLIELGIVIPAKGKPEGEVETADSKVKTEKAVKAKGKPEGEA